MDAANVFGGLYKNTGESYCASLLESMARKLCGAPTKILFICAAAFLLTAVLAEQQPIKGELVLLLVSLFQT